MDKLLGFSFEFYVNAYILICGAINDDDIDKIIKFYDVDVSYEERKNVLDHYKYVNGYYTFSKELLDEFFFRVRDGLSIHILTGEKFLDYIFTSADIDNSLKDILKGNEDLVQKVKFFETFYEAITSPSEDEIDFIINDLEIDSDTYYKLRDFINDNADLIRYYKYYGRTKHEYKIDKIVEDYCMINVPKDRTLLECIKLLNDSAKKDIYELYGVDEEKLENKILNKFDERIKRLTKKCYKDFVDESYSYLFEEDDFRYGFIFSYKEDEYKICVPKEIKERLKIVKKRNLLEDKMIKETQEFIKKYDICEILFRKEQKLRQEYLEQKEILEKLKEENKSLTKEYIKGYVLMNGVIERGFLKRLLKERHNMDIEFADMNDVVLRDLEGIIFDDKFYSVIDVDKVDELLTLKKVKRDYRVCNRDIIDFELNFINNLNDFVNNLSGDILEIKTLIFNFLKMGIYSIDYISNELNCLNISDSDKNEILDFIDYYKDKVTIWSLNGYTFNEKGTIKVEKVGRNEPCPCGSGLKYKKCCGR